MKRTHHDGRAAVAGPSRGAAWGGPLAFARQAAPFCRRRPPYPHNRVSSAHTQNECAPARAVRLPVGSPPCALAFCALRVLPRRCASLAALVRSGAARPAPLRGPGPAYPPSLRSPGPPLGPSGCGSTARPCLRAFALGGLSLPPSALRLALAALRAPWSVALASSRARLGAARRLAASSRGRPLRGFGGGCLRPGAVGGAVRRLFSALAPGLLCSRAPAPAALLRCGALPLRPPAPPPPAGWLRGARCLRLGGFGPRCFAAPPGLGSSSRAPSHCSGCGQGSSRAVPALALAAALFLAQGLDKGEHLRYYVGALPVPVLRHPPARVSVGRRKNSGRNAGVLFLPVLSATFAKASGGDLPPFP